MTSDDSISKGDGKRGVLTTGRAQKLDKTKDAHATDARDDDEEQDEG